MSNDAPMDHPAEGSSSAGAASSRPAAKDHAAQDRVPITAILGDGTAEDFDWDEYTAGYKGRALITRLSHISSFILHQKPDAPIAVLCLARDAIERALPLIKETWDTSLYSKASDALTEAPLKRKFEPIGAIGVPQGTSREAAGRFDIEWAERSREEERKEMSKLDTELKGYSSNLIRESMRLTYLAFAQVNLKCGRVPDVLKSYTSAREYSTSPAHHVELGVGILEACLAFNLPHLLPGHLSKLESVLDRAYPAGASSSARPNAQDTASMTAGDLRDARERDSRASEMRTQVGVKIRVARGLVAMLNREYERAGRDMCAAVADGLGEWDGKAITTTDAALVAGTCTLATSSRNRIRSELLDGIPFRSAVDDSHAWLVRLIRAYIDAEYGELAQLLQRAETPLLRSPFLAQHASALLGAIRTRAMVQYAAPFSSVRIALMASAFGMAEDDMLRAAERLVVRGDIKGRLDLVDGIIEMAKPDARREMFARALEMGKESSKVTQAALLRLRLQEAKIVVDPRPGASAASAALGSLVSGGFLDLAPESEGEEQDEDVRAAIEASLAT